MDNPAERALPKIEAAVGLFKARDYAGTLEQAGEADDILEAALGALGQETALDAEAKHAPKFVRYLEEIGVLEDGDVPDPEAKHRERANAARSGASGGFNARAEALDMLDRAWSDYRRLTGNYPLVGSTWRDLEAD